MSDQVSAVDDVLSEYMGIEAQMADPEIIGDQDQFRKLSKRYNQLQPTVTVARELEQVRADLAEARELAHEDREFAAEAERLSAREVELEESLADLLAPREPHEGDDIIMEIKAGAGGEEAALFAGDLVRMYEKYADKHGFTYEVLGLSESDLGGVKDMTLSFRSKGNSPDGAWSVFKFEGGVHRVQRVPVTESQGRIQTSAAGVLVYPEPDEVEQVEIDDKDIRVDVYRSSGKGGQGVNTTDSAVRITHEPGGDLPEGALADPEQGPRPAGVGRPAAADARGRSRCCRRRRPPRPGAHHGPLRAHPHLQLAGESHLRSPHRF